MADLLESNDDTATARPDEASWAPQSSAPVQYPTRMARRRALQAEAAGRTRSLDPHITERLLRQVEHGLKSVPDVWEPAPVDAPEVLPGHRTRRPRRARRVLVAGLAFGLVAAGAVVAVTSQQRGAPTTVTQPAVVARQNVVVLALAQSGQVTGVSLLASGLGASQQVLVPSRLVLDVPGAGQVPLTRALAPGPSAVGAAVADALDIRVDATWVLNTAALAGIVDAVGGVVVDVDVDVTQGTGAGAAVLIGAGPRQRLSGAQAAAYAQLIVGDEPEASRLARQEEVLAAVLGALPQDSTQRSAVVVRLPGAPRGAALQAVVTTTGGLRHEAATNQLASTVLPVDDIDAGGDVTSYGLDAAATALMVRSRLAGAALSVPSGGRTRVLVQNGVGTPGLGDAARSRLVAAGLRYVGGGNANGFGVDQSLVLLPDGSTGSRARGKAVVQALGLKDSALRVSDAAPTVADVVVVLGADFRPR